MSIKSDIKKKPPNKTKLIVFGSNKYHELIIENEIIKQPESVKIEADCIVDSVSGMNHTYLFLCNGDILCCGDNSKYQFAKKDIKSPFERVSGLKEFKIVSVSSGGYHAVAITKDGQLVAWGNNEKNQLAQTKTETPVHVTKIDGFSNNFVVQVACGLNHCLALTRNSTLFSWGCNEYGQLGLGNVDTKTNPIAKPTQITGLESLPIHQISAGDNFSICVSISGSVFTWGTNNYCQLGIGQTSTEKSSSSFPIYLKSIKDIRVCYISCGSNHTALLTEDGGVFTFGDNQYGQLGLGNKENQTSPRKVPELMGSTVIQISCGANFTLALVKDSMNIYGFGISDKGQLGTIKNIVDVPKKIDMAVNNKNSSKEKSLKIRKLCAGGNHTIILLIDDKNRICEDFRKPMYKNFTQISRLCDNFYLEITKSKSKKLSEEQKNFIYTVMGSFGCLAASFLDKSEKNNHFYKTKSKSGIDIDLCVKFQQMIHEMLSSDEQMMLRIHIYENSLSTHQNQRNYPAIECLRALIILLFSPLMAHTDSYEYVNVPLYNSINSLSDIPKGIIDAWISNLLPRYFKRIVEAGVNLVRYYVSKLPDGKKNNIPAKYQTHMAATLEFLKICYTVNERNKMISYNCFYVTNINDKIDIERNFIEWATASTSYKNIPFSFCTFPFIFDGKAKSRLLQVEAGLFMRNAVLETHTNLLMSILAAQEFIGAAENNGGQNPDSMLNETVIAMENPFFIINVNRESILEDTLKQLKAANNKDFKKPLKISFSNEEAVDDGGVVKEFFLLIIKEIMLPKQGLFRCYKESNMCYFEQNVTKKNDVYKCVGQLCGLAIYNAVIVDLHFPLALFKKLQGDLPNLDDLVELDPVLGRSLQQILDYSEPDFKEVFELYHEITWSDSAGKMHHSEQFKKGKNTPVTLETKEQYVMDYIQFLLSDNVSTSFESFKTGFFLVAVGSVIKLFRPIELQEMIVGTEITDWIELQKNTRYEGEYWIGHKVIKWFWEIFKDFNLTQKKKFLRFLTGCDRAPITGMGEFKLTIQPTNGGDKYYPAAHTCYNLLDLPKYSSKSILKERLLVSIENTEGFGLV